MNWEPVGGSAGEVIIDPSWWEATDEEDPAYEDCRRGCGELAHRGPCKDDYARNT